MQGSRLLQIFRAKWYIDNWTHQPIPSTMWGSIGWESSESYIVSTVLDWIGLHMVFFFSIKHYQRMSRSGKAVSYILFCWHRWVEAFRLNIRWAARGRIGYGIYSERFRNVRSRCYSLSLSDEQLAYLAFQGLSAPIRDRFFCHEFDSLAHLMQTASAHESWLQEAKDDQFWNYQDQKEDNFEAWVLTLQNWGTCVNSEIW